MLTMSVIAGVLPAWRVSKESILKAIWGRWNEKNKISNKKTCKRI
jgi:hypothetical protein